MSDGVPAPIVKRILALQRERDELKLAERAATNNWVDAEARVAHLEGALREGADALNAFRRDRVCAYGAEDVAVTYPANFLCDCKYGRDKSIFPGSEQTGCPELRVIVTSLRAALAASPTMTPPRRTPMSDDDDFTTVRKAMSFSYEVTHADGHAALTRIEAKLTDTERGRDERNAQAFDDWRDAQKVIERQHERYLEVCAHSNEQQDKLEAAEARVAHLEGALERIAAMKTVEIGMTERAAVSIARTALTPQEDSDE